MVSYQSIFNRETSVAIVGMGYVGLPLAVAFGKKVKTIGFDISESRIEMLKNNADPSRELSEDELKSTEIDFTSDLSRLRESQFIIVAVPTPIYDAKNPDLRIIKSASKTIGENLSKGSIVVFESTVYPGLTEEVCGPILEKTSGLKQGIDFKLGYSPERINPGDREHTLERIIKVVSGEDPETLETVAKVYELVVKAGVHRTPSIKAAEAAKVIENTQRDLNIALMNELSVIFNKMDIDTNDVLEAAGTKWNFLRFYPGLVGGHCIGVDPYYLTHKASLLGYDAKVILAGRNINDSMGKYVAENTIKRMIHNGIPVKGSKVLVMGLTFKENVSDIRNTKVVDIINELETFGVDVVVTDAYASAEESLKEYGVNLVELKSVPKVDAIVVATPHDAYKKLTTEDIKELFTDKNRAVVVDVKRIFNKNELEKAGINYWGL